MPELSGMISRQHYRVFFGTRKSDSIIAHDKLELVLPQGTPLGVIWGVIFVQGTFRKKNRMINRIC